GGWAAILEAIGVVEAVPVPGKTASVLATRLGRSGGEVVLDESLVKAIDRTLSAARDDHAVDLVGLAVQAAAFYRKHGLDTRAPLAALRDAIGWQVTGVREQLGVEMHDLTSIDEAWTRAHVLPHASEAAASDEIREAARLALFNENNQPEALFPDILKLAVEALEGVGWTKERVDWYGQAEVVLSSLGQLLVETMAGAASRWPSVPQSEWSERFFFHAPPIARAAWTKEFGDRLRLRGDGAADPWEWWLRDFWEQRRHGDPSPISAEEAGALLGWVKRKWIPLADLADVILASPPPKDVRGHDVSAWIDRAEEDPAMALAVLTRVVEEREHFPLY